MLHHHPAFISSDVSLDGEKMLLLNKEQIRKIIYSDKTKSYTYGLCRNNGEIFYVGVGIRNRVLTHLGSHELSNCTNKLKVNTTKKAMVDGIKFVVFIIHKDRQVCLDVEKKIIAHYRRISDGGTLTNLSEGGEVGPTGVVISQETRDKLRQRGLENKDILSQKNKDWWANLPDEDKAHKVERMLSNANNENARSLISASTKARWEDPEYKEKLKKKYAEFQSSPEQRERNSQRMKDKWKNPEYRAAMSEKSKKAWEKRLADKADSVERQSFANDNLIE